MKEVKQKPDSTGSARTKKKSARMPKELAAKAVLKAKETVKEKAKPTTDADDSPDRYAESRIEQSAEYTVEKAKETLKPQRRRIRRETEQPKEDTHSEPFEREQYRDAPRETAPRTKGRETLEVKTRSEEPLRRNNKPVSQDEPTTHGVEPSSQMELYKRSESAKQIVREKQQNDFQPSVREPERSPSIREMEVPTTAQLDAEPKSIREAESIRSERLTDTLVRDRSSFEAEPTNSPKIKEYQVRKWHDQTKEQKNLESYKQDDSEPDLSVSEREPIRDREPVKEPTLKERPVQENTSDRTLRTEATEQSPRQDVREYQVKKWREMSKDAAEQPSVETRSIREKPTDIKELERKAPSDRIRNVSSPAHEQETVTEPPSVETQQRQLSMDKYRNK